LIEEGGTIQEVKEAARHKSITTTAKYMKAHEEKLKALLERRARFKTSGQLRVVSQLG
jgi:site-specific recombinase XerD